MNELKEYDCELPDLPGRKHFVGKLLIVRHK
jgi:hypothetical protein